MDALACPSISEGVVTPRSHVDFKRFRSALSRKGVWPRQVCCPSGVKRPEQPMYTKFLGVAYCTVIIMATRCLSDSKIPMDYFLEKIIPGHDAFERPSKVLSCRKSNAM